MSESQMNGNDETQQSTRQEKDTNAEDPNYVRLTVVGQRENEVHFKVKKSTKMAKVKQKYAEKHGIAERVDQLRFLLDGERISDDATADELGIDTEALIEVFQMQEAGKGEYC